MNIIFCSSEANPLTKTGGLADVIYSLGRELVKLGNNVSIFIPFYSQILLNRKYSFEKGFDFVQQMGWRHSPTEIYKTVIDGIDYYLIKCDQYFNRAQIYGEHDDDERFAYFSRACISAIEKLNLKPDIIHTHDWQVGMVACLIKEQHIDYFINTKFVYTIHNPLFKGKVNVEDYVSFYDLPRELYYNGTLRYGDGVSTLKSGIIYNDIVTTVSPTHRNELLDPTSSMGLSEILALKGERFIGVLNGCDYNEFSPLSEASFLNRYDTTNFYTVKMNIKTKLLNSFGIENNGKPLYVVVSRLTWQKGIDHLLTGIDYLAKKENKVIVLGDGDMETKGRLEGLRKKYPNHIFTLFTFNNEIAHLIYAASDFYLMPSIYEPCGISQLIALKYGSLPIVRSTGGLKDTIIPYNGKNIDVANGFAYQGSDATEFVNAIIESYKLFFNLPKRKKMVVNAMNADFSCTKSAKEYIDIYTQLINNY